MTRHLLRIALGVLAGLAAFLPATAGAAVVVGSGLSPVVRLPLS